MAKNRIEKRERVLAFIANYAFEVRYFDDKPYVKLEEAEYLVSLAKAALKINAVQS